MQWQDALPMPLSSPQNFLNRKYSLFRWKKRRCTHRMRFENGWTAKRRRFLRRWQTARCRFPDKTWLLSLANNEGSSKARWSLLAMRLSVAPIRYSHPSAPGAVTHRGSCPQRTRHFAINFGRMAVNWATSDIRMANKRQFI